MQKNKQMDLYLLTDNSPNSRNNFNDKNSGIEYSSIGILKNSNFFYKISLLISLFIID